MTAQMLPANIQDTTYLLPAQSKGCKRESSLCFRWCKFKGRIRIVYTASSLKTCNGVMLGTANFGKPASGPDDNDLCSSQPVSFDLNQSRECIRAAVLLGRWCCSVHPSPCPSLHTGLNSVSPSPTCISKIIFNLATDIHEEVDSRTKTCMQKTSWKLLQCSTTCTDTAARGAASTR